MQPPKLQPLKLKTNKAPIFDIHANPDEDPELPYSGGSSSSFINDDLNAPAEKIKRKQRQERSDLLPVAKDIFAFINEERTAIADIRAYMNTLGASPDKDKLMAEYRARELYITYLGRFETWMLNRLSKTPASKLRTP